MRKLVVAVVIFLLVFSLQTKASSDYKKVPEGFFELVDDNKLAAAIDSVYEDNPWTHLATEKIRQLKSQFTNAADMLGDYHGYELLYDKTFASERFAHVAYLMLYDRQPVVVQFQLYRPTKEWRIYNFSFDTEFPTNVQQSAVYKMTSGGKGIE